jgi:hypothetical protein
MARMPSSVAEFLAGKRSAVAGVSRQPQQAATAFYDEPRLVGPVLKAISIPRGNAPRPDTPASFN